MLHVPSTGSRVAARLLDEIIIGLFCLPVLIPLFWGRSDLWTPWPWVIYLCEVPLMYESLSIWVFSQSLGKWVFSLQVCSNRNPKLELNFWQCLLRSLVGRLTLFFSWAPQALALFRYDRTHLADWLAQTRVISLRPNPKRTRIRPWWGVIFIFLFLETGLSSAALFFQSLEISGKGVRMSSDFEAEKP